VWPQRVHMRNAEHARHAHLGGLPPLCRHAALQLLVLVLRLVYPGGVQEPLGVGILHNGKACHA
jgi:hypothetical protein